MQVEMHCKKLRNKKFNFLTKSLDLSHETVQREGEGETRRTFARPLNRFLIKENDWKFILTIFISNTKTSPFTVAYIKSRNRFFTHKFREAICKRGELPSELAAVTVSSILLSYNLSNVKSTNSVVFFFWAHIW